MKPQPSNQAKQRSKKWRTRQTRQNSVPAMIQPLYKPVVPFVRTLQGGTFDISCDGINPSVGIFNFSLNDLPSSTEFTALFQVYKISKVILTWRPEYTELTDAALVSNAINVNFNSAVDPSGNTPTNVDAVLSFQNCRSTGITKDHSRSFVPYLFMDGTSPCQCYVSTNSASTNFWGLAYGIPPTGVAMTFRCTAKYKVICAGSR
jgi:hypothetical protein